MSRLHTRTYADTKGKPVTVSANKKASTIHTWMVENYSRVAISITTRWDKEQPKPTIIVELQPDVAYEVIGPKGNTIALTR